MLGCQDSFGLQSELQPIRLVCFVGMQQAAARGRAIRCIHYLCSLHQFVLATQLVAGPLLP